MDMGEIAQVLDDVLGAYDGAVAVERRHEPCLMVAEGGVGKAEKIEFPARHPDPLSKNCAKPIVDLVLGSSGVVEDG